jgi:hypothetical protein
VSRLGAFAVVTFVGEEIWLCVEQSIVILFVVEDVEFGGEGA